MDDEGIRDIADVMSSEQPLFAEGEDPSVVVGGTPSEKKSVGGKRSD